MNKEEVKKLLPIIQAFAEGKTIEMYLKCDNKWEMSYNPPFNPENKYRIKPEPKYRPFKDADECWNEMLKHQPFGWVKDIEDDSGASWYENITGVMCDSVGYTDRSNGISYEEFMRVFAFADGTPFGIKEGGKE